MERAARVIPKLKLPPGAVSPGDLAGAAWSAAVGPRIAARTRPLTVVSSRLVVEVEDLVWQRQLFVLKAQILRRLEEVLGQPLVRDIEYRLAVRRREPQRVDKPSSSADEADRIEDPLLRNIYKQQRKRRPA